jgi:hypothetical protein
MNLFNKLDPIAFLLSLTIGFFVVYIFGPRPVVLYQYPTPENEKTTVYVDNVNNCYKYHSNKVACPANKKLIHQIPIQIGNNSSE